MQYVLITNPEEVYDDVSGMVRTVKVKAISEIHARGLAFEQTGQKEFLDVRMSMVIDRSTNV